jgi:N-acetylglucosamine repressor
MIQSNFMETIHKVGRRLPLADLANGRGALTDLRRRNAVELLGRLRRGEASTRADLARITGLDPKTVTNLTDILLKERLIVADGLAGSVGGRPAERLALNPEGLFAVGVDLGATKLRTVVLDFTGTVRASTVAVVPRSGGAKKIMAQAVDQIRKNLAVSRAPRRRVAGIGFACPGFLDRREGVALEAVHLLGWRNVPVGGILGRAFRMPVSLEESSRAAALGEMWFGAGRDSRDFLTLDFGYGIGTGIVTGGGILYGVSESGGELGHTVVKPRGDRCHCGHRGCLETVASGEAIARRSGRATARAAVEAAAAGDVRCRRIIADAGRLLGAAAANLINLLNPGAIVLHGGLCGAGDLLLVPFREALERHAVPRSLAAANITISTVGEFAGAMGAAMIPLHSYFQEKT